MKELSDAEDIETRLVRANGKGTTLKSQLWNSLQWPIYIINSIDNTKVPCYTQQHVTPSLNSELRHNDKKEMPRYFEFKGWRIHYNSVLCINVGFLHNINVFIWSKFL